MPANLTPQYLKAEEAYRRAQNPRERIVGLERMLALVPKHKGTDRLQGDLRAKLKEAREEERAEREAPRSGTSYRILRQGAGTVIVLGGPNSGKSRLVCSLTAAHPLVAEYPFTTRTPLAGMMTCEGIQVQLIDTPPITACHAEPYLPGFVRSADLVLLCVDGSSDDGPDAARDVVLQLRNRKTILSDRTGFDQDDFSVVHVKTLCLITRGRDPDAFIRQQLFTELEAWSFTVSLIDLDAPADVETISSGVVHALDLVRIYTKRPGETALLKEPLTLPRGGTVEDLAAKVHEELAAAFRYAKIWRHGSSESQTVGREYVLQDEDVVELHS